MEQQRLLFEYSPFLILPCIGVGLAYAYLLYHKHHTWSVLVNRGLFGLRAALVMLLALLLVGPILKLTVNVYEKPLWVVLFDNSTSVAQAMDSASMARVENDIAGLSDLMRDKGFEVVNRTLSKDAADVKGMLHFDLPKSDLNGAVRDVQADFEGRNIKGIILVSDGIYNSGSSPLYSLSRAPVYTVGIGDTTQYMDINLRNLVFNKIAYQGNRFPLRAEVALQRIGDQTINVSVFQKGRLVANLQKPSGHQSILQFDFEIDASEKGLQRFDVVVEPLTEEQNKKNNRASAYVEVVEGKKRILVVAPSPHPDIKALRAVVEKNSNFEFVLEIPGTLEAAPAKLDPQTTDLAIFHQVLDLEGRTSALYNKFVNSPTALLLIVGPRTNLRQLASSPVALAFETPGQWDEAMPVVNPNFHQFNFVANVGETFSKFPPIAVPFGKFVYPPQASSLLLQRIGSVPTERPMLYTLGDDSRKVGAFIGEGLWRWRLDEFGASQHTDAFDEVFSKLIQYLSTHEDKRRFRCFPLRDEFSDAESVTFESQVYNELYEQIFGNRIDLEIKDEGGASQKFSYVTGPGATRYRMGALKEGVYSYTATTDVEGNKESVSGAFIVRAQNIESQNLTADFGLLRAWSQRTGGKFYEGSEMDKMRSDFESMKATSRIHSEASFNPLINLKWVFVVLLVMISLEWFVRKYAGGY